MSEFNEFEPRLKSTKNRFQLSAGLNLETLNTILSETKPTIFKPRLKFKPPLKFFKFCLGFLLYFSPKKIVFQPKDILYISLYNCKGAGGMI